MYDCSGGCWGSLLGKEVRVNRVGRGLMCYGGGEKTMLQMMKCINSNIILHRVDLEKMHLRTEYHTWTMFFFLNHSLSVTICLIQSSFTQNLPFVCGTSRHFIALMATFVMLSHNAREWERKRESLCEDASWRECLSHNTPQMCLSPK